MSGGDGIEKDAVFCRLFEDDACLRACACAWTGMERNTMELPPREAFFFRFFFFSCFVFLFFQCGCPVPSNGRVRTGGSSYDRGTFSVVTGGVPR